MARKCISGESWALWQGQEDCDLRGAQVATSLPCRACGRDDNDINAKLGYSRHENRSIGRPYCDHDRARLQEHRHQGITAGNLASARGFSHSPNYCNKLDRSGSLPHRTVFPDQQGNHRWIAGKDTFLYEQVGTHRSTGRCSSRQQTTGTFASRSRSGNFPTNSDLKTPIV